MRLARGALLGPYEITAPIGKGGMGEVYRARDTKLGRDVAIRVLPEELAADAERIARFEREARLLASLNHSNIAGIHGFEESDGVRALVLELVEGPTLAEYMERGASIHAAGPHPHRGRSGDSAPARRLRALPVEEAIAIAKEMDDVGSGSRSRSDSPRSQACEGEGDGRRHGEGARLRARVGQRRELDTFFDGPSIRRPSVVRYGRPRRLGCACGSSPLG